jgi:PTS system cellobiose-specific IIC component
VEKFISMLQKKLMPIANKLSNNKFMNSLGQTFQLLLPIIIIGSFACLGAFLDIPFWQNFVTSTGLQLILMTIQSLTLSIIALYVVIVLPFQYAQKLKINAISASVISLMAFLLLTPPRSVHRNSHRMAWVPGLVQCHNSGRVGAPVYQNLA